MKEKNPLLTPKRLQIIGLIVTIGLILNFAYQAFTKGTLHPQPRRRCDLHQQTCSVIIPEGKIVSLTVNPNTLPSNELLTFTVDLQRFNPDKVALFLNTVPAQSSSKGRILPMQSLGNHQYQVQTTLTRTDNPQQKWVALVEITTGTTVVAAAFRFTVSPD